jgi:KDEL-tailed cysteine endopeptidase
MMAIAFIPRRPPHAEALTIHKSSPTVTSATSATTQNPLALAGIDSVIYRRALFRTWCTVNNFEEPEKDAIPDAIRAKDRFVVWNDNLDKVFAHNSRNLSPQRMSQYSAFTAQEMNALFHPPLLSPERFDEDVAATISTSASHVHPIERVEAWTKVPVHMSAVKEDEDTTPKCDACQSTIAKVDSILKSTNATVQTLAKFAKDLCDVFATKVVAQECDDIAGDMEAIVDLLANGVSPSGVCRTIGYCVAHDVVSMHNSFQTWMIKHGKVYRTLREYTKRLEVFARNILRAHEHNASGQHTHKLSVKGPFADMTADEFRSDRRRSGFLAHKRTHPGLKRAKRLRRPRGPAPQKVDWRTKGVVAAPGDQGQCGSCYAWSAVEAVQSANAIKTGKLINLSEQQIIDCDTGDNGCNGGLMDNVFQYIISNGGIDTSKDYTYTAQDGSCDQRKQSEHAVTIKSFQDVKPNSPDQLKLAVAQQPVSVAVCAEGDTWQLYDSGVVSTGCCTDLDHGVLAIGFDVSGTSSDPAYWLVANSWGSMWGEDGTIRLALNVSDPQGMCGIAMAPSFPIV